jgi:hypothetical protein
VTFLQVDHRLYSRTCALVRVTDTVDAAEEVLFDDIACTPPFPVGREYQERSFHHTPDIGMGDAGRRFVIYLKAGDYAPTPAMRVFVADAVSGGTSYGIRAINDWSHGTGAAGTVQFHEILLELP